jgi:ferritin
MAKTPINPDVAKELQRQLNQELASAHAYEALSLWCEDSNLKGFAHYFIQQAHEERTHARRFMKHLLDRKHLPQLSAVPAASTQFDSVLDVAKKALSMEQQNTAGINSAYEIALREKDYAAQVFLHSFINEQVEEEDWADEMVDRAARANCAGGIGELDRHIARYLEDDPSAVEEGGAK